MSSEIMQFPPSVEVVTDTVVDVYVDYPTMGDFVDYYGPIEDNSVTNIVNNYYLNGEINDGTYKGGAEAPVTGSSFFQKIINPPAGSTLDTVKQAAQTAALAGMADTLTNYIRSGVGQVYSSEAMVVYNPDAAKYSVGGLMAIAPEAAICGIAALMGYSIGEDIYDINPDFWDEMMQIADPFKFNSPEQSIVEKILGVNYGDSTYLDSRFYEAVKQFLSNYAPLDADYSYEYKGEEQSGYDIVSAQTFRIPVEFACPSVSYQLSSPTYYDVILNGYADVTITGSGNLRYSLIWVASPSTAQGYEEYCSGFCSLYLIVASDSNFSYNIVGTTLSTEHTDATVRSASGNITGTTKILLYDLVSVRSVHYSHYGGWMKLSDLPPHVDNINGSDVYPLLMNADEYNLPTGITEWTGDQIQDPTANGIHVVVNSSTSTTVPFYPVAMPAYPYTRPDPATNPNPTVVYVPTTQVVPYIIQSPYLPQTNPESDPEDDPSDPSSTIVLVVLPGGTGKNDDKDDGDSPGIVIPTVLPPFSLVSGSNGSMFNVFNPTSAQLNAFSDWLWVKWTDANLNKIINNPFDGVISLHELYATPATAGAKEITSGFLKSDVSANMVSPRYTSIYCGSVVIPERFENYLDYTPYTKAFVYLPFIGFVALNADDIVGRAVGITYYVDSYSGACLATIETAIDDGNGNTVTQCLYQYPGNCAVQLPISGGSQASLTAGLWMAGSSAISSVVNGFTSGATSLSASEVINGITSGISDISATLLTRKSEVQHSGNLSGNFGAMAGKKPYIVIKRPRQVIVSNYQDDYGYPAHKRVIVGACTGYLRVREVNVISATATNDEKTRIEELLKEGVYVT